MELHPFLETDIRPAPKWWYVLAATGDCPSMRVGHSATFVAGRQAGEHNKVFIIGGANPSQIFNEVYVLDLHTRSWDFQESPGFRGRYEHASFTVDSHPGKIFIFGGATQTGNLNDLQSMDVNTGQWADVETSGTAPSPRTHRCGAVVGNKFYVYSGGQSGPDPVVDRKVHCLDMETLVWSSLTPRGDSPKPRHGHMMVVHQNKIFLHGGMAGSTFYDDLHVLDLDKQSWTCMKKKKSPPPRAAHDGLCHKGRMYLFGGMSKAGALEDAHTFDLESNNWSKFELEGPAPANRLDFALCQVRMPVPVHSSSSPRDVAASAELSDTRARAREVLDRELKPGSASSRDSDSASVDEALYALDYDPTQSAENTKNVQGDKEECGDGAVPVSTEEMDLVLINGGMDTEGEIFDDTLVLLLSRSPEGSPNLGDLQKERASRLSVSHKSKASASTTTNFPIHCGSKLISVSVKVAYHKMIEITCNDRLGKKVRVKCNEDDTVGDLKKLIAAQTGTRYDKIVLKKWYTIFKDHVTLGDYEIHDGMNLELYYQ